MTEKDIAIFCKNVLYLREKHSIGREEMAETCGVSVEELAEIECGTLPKNTSVDLVVRLSQRFQISAEKLFLPL